MEWTDGDMIRFADIYSMDYECTKVGEHFDPKEKLEEYRGSHARNELKQHESPSPQDDKRFTDEIPEWIYNIIENYINTDRQEECANRIWVAIKQEYLSTKQEGEKPFTDEDMLSFGRFILNQAIKKFFNDQEIIIDKQLLTDFNNKQCQH